MSNENVHTNVSFATPYRFRVRTNMIETDRQTDRRTGKTRNADRSIKRTEEKPV